MEIVNFSSNIVPLSTSYIGDVDVIFNSILDHSEDDISIFREEYLKNSNNKINNYSSLYLTSKKTVEDVIDIKRLKNDQSVEIFNTTISNTDGFYFTISGNSDAERIDPYFTTKEDRFIDPTHRIFEITLLDPISAKITHKNRNKTVYTLNYDYVTGLYFSNNPTGQTIFNYILDKRNQKFSFFLRDVNDIIKNVIVDIDGNLTLIDNVTSFRDYAYNINYYAQSIEPKLNSSWVSYNPNYKNEYEVVVDKSTKDLKNNFLVTTQYTHVTGNTLESNLLVLKNQKTNKNYSYRSDYLEKNHKNVPTVDNRNYFSLFTGNEQEKGEYSVVLGYEFYNADYKFVKDKYTSFKTPESLYPYEKININDLEWNNRGAIAGENPHTSDRIFKNKIKNKQNGGEYLCSWLRKDRNGNSVWLDRYYYPDKTTFAKAFESTATYNFPDPLNELLLKQLSENEYYDIPFVYNSLEEESKHTPQTVKDAIYGEAFFDKKSDLVIEPDSEYLYFRIGDNYVKNILDAIKDELLINGLDLKNSNDASILITGDVDEVEYTFNNDSYTRIENYNDINNEHQFTISFWLKSDDWTKGFGHQILGNLNDKGFALLDDEKVTPIITIQSGQKVYLYNTDFSLLDISSLENEFSTVIGTSKIKDIYRTEHLNSYYTISIS